MAESKLLNDDELENVSGGAADYMCSFHKDENGNIYIETWNDDGYWSCGDILYFDAGKDPKEVWAEWLTHRDPYDGYFFNGERLTPKMIEQEINKLRK